MPGSVVRQWLKVFAFGLFLPAVAGAADTLAVYLVNPQPGERSICELRFTLSSPIPPRAVFRLVFPSQFDLSEVQVVGSDRIDGGFRFRRSGQELVLTRAGRGHQIPAGRLVDIKIANVRNPRDTAAGGTVQLTIEGVGGGPAVLTSRVQWRAPRQRLEQ